MKFAGDSESGKGGFTPFALCVGGARGTGSVADVSFSLPGAAAPPSGRPVPLLYSCFEVLFNSALWGAFGGAEGRLLALFSEVTPGGAEGAQGLNWV